MRIRLLCLVGITITLALETVNSEGVARDAFYQNARLGKGVNPGNALEAPEEGQWGMRLEESYFDPIAAAGFNLVRLPVLREIARAWTHDAGTAKSMHMQIEQLRKVIASAEQDQDPPAMVKLQDVTEGQTCE